MRLHWALCLLALVAVARGQAADETDNLSTASSEQNTKSSDAPSLPLTDQDSADPNPATKMEPPSLPSPTEEIDLLAAPAMPSNGEQSAEAKTTEATLKSAEKEESKTEDNKDDSMNPLMAAPKLPEESISETPIAASTPKSEEPSTEDAFAQKSSVEATTIDNADKPKTEQDEAASERPAEAPVESTSEKPTEVKQVTDVPESKSSEAKLSSEAANTDPFQQGSQPQTATEKSKEVEIHEDSDDEIGAKSQDADLKTSAEPLPAVVKETSSEKVPNQEQQKPTEHATDLELKERPLVPIVHEQSEETTSAKPEETKSNEDKSTKPEDQMTNEEKTQEEEKMNQAPKEEEKSDLMPKEDTTEKPKEEAIHEEEKGDLMSREDATKAPAIDESTHDDSTAKESSAPSEEAKDETPQPMFVVPMPTESIHQHTAHQVSSAEVTSKEMPKSVESTTAAAVVESEDMEPETLATGVPSETAGQSEAKEESMEKVTESPAERPQFEEPKMEATEKPEAGLEKSVPEMKEPEEFGHGTDAPSAVPTAETHLMTPESAESNQPNIASSTEMPVQPADTTIAAQSTEISHSTDTSHSTDDEGLFAGDMKNLFANHQHESTTQPADATTKTIEEEPKFAEEITETEDGPKPTAEPQPEPEPKSKDTEPSATPEPSAEPKPEPTAEPSAEPTPEPSAEPSPTQHVHHSHAVHVPENIVTDTIKTPFSLRFTNIEFSDEFRNLNSGAARKLHDQIYDDLSRAFENTLGDNYVGFELLNFRSGSLIVDGRLLSRDELGNPSMVAAKLEDTLQKAGGRLGGNTLDLKSVYVDGIVSKGGAQLDQNGETTAAANTGYIVGGSIAIGVLIMAFIVFAVIVFGVNARRQKSRTLKLKEELSMAEHGRSPFNGGLNGRQNGQGGVNLMSYGNTTPGQSSANGHSTTTTAAANNSPMLLNSSQFSAPQGFQSSN